MTQPVSEPATAHTQRRRIKIPSERERNLVIALSAGQTLGNAYKTAYNRPDLDERDAANRACGVRARPHVTALLNQLMHEVEAKAKASAVKAQANQRNAGIKECLLTLNDRLSILGKIAKDPKAKPSDKARAIDVYTKIAGGYAPQQVQLTGAEGGPIQTESTVNATVTTMTVQQKIALFRARREGATPQPN